MYKVEFFMSGRKEPFTLLMSEDDMMRTQQIELTGWIIIDDVYINGANLDALVMEKVE